MTSPPSSFSLCPERRRDSGDQRRRAAAPRGLWRAGMDPRIEGDPAGSRWVGGDSVCCRRRAPRRRKASGKSGFGAAVVLDRNGVVGMVYGRMRGLLVERTESGRPWWCRIGRGSGGGCRCRRWGRRLSPSRLAAMGGLGEHSKASCVHGEARGPPFIARRGRFRGGRISSPANRLAVACRATWRGWG